MLLERAGTSSKQLASNLGLLISTSLEERNTAQLGTEHWRRARAWRAHCQPPPVKRQPSLVECQPPSVKTNRRRLSGTVDGPNPTDVLRPLLRWSRERPDQTRSGTRRSLVRTWPIPCATGSHPPRLHAGVSWRLARPLWMMSKVADACATFGPDYFPQAQYPNPEVPETLGGYGKMGKMGKMGEMGSGGWCRTIGVGFKVQGRSYQRMKGSRREGHRVVCEIALEAPPHRYR